MAEPGSRASLLVTGSGTILHTAGNTVGGDANSETLIAITDGGAINSTGRPTIASENAGDANTSSLIVSGTVSLAAITNTLTRRIIGTPYFTLKDGSSTMDGNVALGRISVSRGNRA